MKFKITLFLTLFFILQQLHPQDDHAQIPNGLQKGYFEINIGAINYPFSQLSLANGYSVVDAVVVPSTAVRLVLAGYSINSYLSTQIIYMRPVLWVNYKGILTPDKNIISNSVRMNIGGLTLKGTLPLWSKFSVYGEAGLGVITRKGFNDPTTGEAVVSNAGYATIMMGGGLKYNLDSRWALQLCGDYIPGKASIQQPYTSFIGTGFSYHFQPFSEEKLKKAAKSGRIHPKQWFQIGYSSNILGYDVNKFVSNNKFPIFWGGDAQVRQGLTLNYQRNIFHNPRVFALDWGVEAGFWQSNLNKDAFFTFSVYPVLRFNFLHSKLVDSYFYYSVAAPTYISKIIIDNINTGQHFTFEDNMGVGCFFGKNRTYNAEIKIGHYSNGNIFTANGAVMVPLSLNLGYCF
jgi:hypothetical protein